MNVKRCHAIVLSAGFLVLGVAAGPGAARAQTVSSQDSVVPNTAVGYGTATGFAMAAHDEIIAAESTLDLSASFMHQQYHENLKEGTGDDENGFTQGVSAGISGLIPNGVIGADLYTALDYDFDAGSITYGGHYLFSGLPAAATDNAVFNRIELRLGPGFDLRDGVEVIPFVAGGYQAWNRNINQKNEIGTDEFYRAGLMGGGVRLDEAVTSRLVLSETAEVLAVVGGGTRSNAFGLNFEFGPTAEERVELGADYVVSGPFHVFGRFDWEHFDYSGSKPSVASSGFYEPLSTTTQFGANMGVAYSFY